ncbi:hypothetical protein HPP92_008007 [Vanilla planifolia]|uniref:Nudix hydrolase domain-containing protein n=1 Tax=Vanilla planifolia TaxID=51239 RepID=A0A835RHJ8_VANPL|nr:hypothetical protein HPP92_008007 [Vanilla planifolia]
MGAAARPERQISHVRLNAKSPALATCSLCFPRHLPRNVLRLVLSKKGFIFCSNQPPADGLAEIRRWRGAAVLCQLGLFRVRHICFDLGRCAIWGGTATLSVVGVPERRGGKGLKSVAKTMVVMAARQGRQLQRYNSCGRRLVVGCIPYKLKMDDSCMNDIDKMVHVLVISSQKGHGMMFPKGGWESDETMKQAASREALEEAGVQGHLESNLGRWMYKSNRYNVFYEGIMFPLNVTEELAYWPEMEVRKRRWVTVAEAMEGCQHAWMREALERLLTRLQQNSDS